MEKQKYNAPAVGQAISIIKLLSESSDGITLANISKSINLNKATCQRILMTLIDEGWASKNDPGPVYNITLEPFRITSQPVNRMSLQEVAHDPLYKLWKDINQTIVLTIPYNNKILYLMVIEADREFRINCRIGDAYPITSKGAGPSIFLAYASKEEIKKIYKDLSPKEIKKIEDTKQNREQLKKDGLICNEWTRGMYAMGTPVFDCNSKCIASAIVIGFAEFYTKDEFIKKMGPKLIETGKSISQKLGHKI